MKKLISREHTCIANEGVLKEFIEEVRYKGTHLMRERTSYYVELAYHAACKSMDPTGLKDYQTIFHDKISEDSWVNGYQDITRRQLENLIVTWTEAVLDLATYLLEDEILDAADPDQILEVNVMKITDHHIDLERSIYEKVH